MKKKVISLDFDDVICPITLHFIKWYNKNNNAALRFEDITGELYSLIGCTEKEEIEKWLLYFSSSHYLKCKPTQETIDILNKLKNEYVLTIVCARDLEFQPFVEPWLQKYLPNIFEKTIFIKENQKNQTKGEICKKIDSKLLVDDNFTHFDSCKINKINFILFNKPWNKNIVYNNKITHLKEINKFLMEKN